MNDIPELAFKPNENALQKYRELHKDLSDNWNSSNQPYPGKSFIWP